MCTYITEILRTKGSAKTSNGWTDVDETVVYFDHPVHFAHEHSLNIDFRNSNYGPDQRIGLELSKESARAMAQAILAILDQVGDL